ncbi:MAG: hypothetical protein CMM40_17350 [Rhodospirillaceae bacterium]|nr:hypothetical protein [Rhodospirillaceae bacterium]MBB57430.1 hypothetical protein [Rhodospirillaceae bacterium]|tara:strand:+ start:4339 stop:5520 length:1182 start_codon:yes stop_codon:yes gene_type:complete
MGKRSLLLSVVGILVLLVGAWTAWWFYSARLAMSSFQGWVSEQRSQGYDINFERIDTGGYPFSLALTATRFGVAAPLRAWTVSGDALTVTFKPWQLDRYQVASDQPLRLSAVVIPESQKTPVVIQDLTGDYLYQRDVSQHQLRLIAADVSGPNGLTIDTIGVSGTMPFRAPQDRDADIMTGHLELVGAKMPGLVPQGLSEQIEAAILDFTVSGPQPNPEHSMAKRLSDWRDAGGGVEVSKIALAWQDLNLSGDGTISLDEYLRPLAAFGMQATGLSETARRFEGAGLIDRQIRRYIEMGVGLLSLGSGQAGMVRFPVTIQDGILSLGPVALSEIPPIVAGAGPLPPAVPAPKTGEITTFPDLAPPPTVSDETLDAGSNPMQGTDPQAAPAPAQ